MITDPNIREQAYQYFIEEAPELLHTIEQELSSLNNLDPQGRPLKINGLMRAAHTLKGGAANVGLEAINKVSHTLEDVFKALYNPDIEIDAEIQTLLFENYECLRLLLTAELNHGTIDQEEILDRSAEIFVKLQDKIGEDWTEQDAFPSSEELGLDVVESFFSQVIPERLEEISVVLNNSDSAKVAEVLRSQGEVFLALAESLNLPGFQEIAQGILTAIETNADRAIEIAQVALINLKDAQEQVLTGDRDRGGEPSEALIQLTTRQDVVEEELTPDRESADVSPQLIEQIDNSENINYDIPTVLVSDSQAEFLQSDESLAGDVPSDRLTTSVDEIWSKETAAESTIEIENSQEIEQENISIQTSVDVDVAAVNLSNSSQESTSVTVPLANNFSPDESSTLVDEIWGQTNTNELNTEPENSQETEQEFIQTSIDVDVAAVNLSDSSQESASIIESSADEITVTESSAVEIVTQKNAIHGELEISEEQPVLSAKNTVDNVYNTNQAKKKIKAPAKQSLRVDLASLEQLNNLMGELLIHHNQNYVRNENSHLFVQSLLESMGENEVIISELIESINELKSANHQGELNKKNLLDLESKLDTVMSNNSGAIKILEDLKSDNRKYRYDWQKKQKLVLNMRDELIEIRMSPIGKLFNRFPYMIEQLVNKYAKKIDLKINGSHILIDKAIEDKLYDPLLHILRNAFDHGIESPEERHHSGKSETGTIELRAYYQGSQTIIEVRDDGKGINLEKIKNRAIERNLLAANRASKISPSKLLEFLFEPGFSTADKVSELSGRGVGLDVVRSQIEALNGTINIESVPQQGTRFSLQIPLTLTIAKLMLCQAGEIVYSLLIDSIERILLPTSNQIKIFKGQKVLHWETETENYTIPVVKLSNLMEYSRISHKNGRKLETNQQQQTQPVLLLSWNGELLGLEVDEILGEQELVIRPVGSAISSPSYVYGCSILSDSRLTLVVDPIALVRESQRNAPYESQRAYLAGAVQPAALPTQPTQPLLPAKSVVSKTLLVVDDSSSLRKTVKLSLQKISNQVLEAENGLDALEKLQQSKNVNLIVCDLEMPHMNGFQFLKAARKNTNFAKIPVIMLTSRTSEQFKQLALGLGATAYLNKPYNEKELLDTILKSLDRN